MFIHNDEFLQGVSDQERETYKESINYYTEKSRREGRVIATAADNLYSVIRANGDMTPDILIQTYKMLSGHFEQELLILQERHAKITAKSN